LRLDLIEFNGRDRRLEPITMRKGTKPIRSSYHTLKLE